MATRSPSAADCILLAIPDVTAKSKYWRSSPIGWWSSDVAKARQSEGPIRQIETTALHRTRHDGAYKHQESQIRLEWFPALSKSTRRSNRQSISRQDSGRSSLERTIDRMEGD